MEEKVLNRIIKNHNDSEGKCGISPLKIMHEFGINYSELKPILNKLHSDKKIITRDGINGILIFKGK